MIFGRSGGALKLLNTCILHYIGLYGGKNNYTKFVLAFPDFGYLNLKDNASMETSQII